MMILMVIVYIIVLQLDDGFNNDHKYRQDLIIGAMLSLKVDYNDDSCNV